MRPVVAWLCCGYCLVGRFVPLRKLRSATDQESAFQMTITVNTKRRRNIPASHLKFGKMLFYSVRGCFEIVVYCVCDFIKTVDVAFKCAI